MKTFLELIRTNLGESYIGKVFSYHEPNTLISREGGFEAFAQAAEGEEITEKTIFIGFELEMGLTKQHTDSEIKEMMKKVYETIPCIIEHDSSIASNAVKRVYFDAEVISAPLTPRRILELAPDIKVLFKELADFGFESHNLDSCGLHFHYTMVDKPNRLEIVSRFWHQLHTWQTEVHKIAGRGYVGYARDLNCDDAIVPQERESIDYIKEKVTLQGFGRNSDHTATLNLQHENTIEMRLCRGTLNFNTFMARVEFFYNMYIQATSLNIITQRMTWNKLISGKYIKQYVTTQNIATLKKAYDWSTKVGVLHRQLTKYDNQMLEMLFKTLLNCKKLSRDVQKLQEYRLAYEVSNLTSYISSAMESASSRYLRLDSLTRTIKSYMTSYSYTTEAGEAYFKEMLQPLHELLQNKPQIALEGAQASDI